MLLGLKITNASFGGIVFSRCPMVTQRRQWHPTPVLLPGESQGQGSLVGCRLWGGTESDTSEIAAAAAAAAMVTIIGYLSEFILGASTGHLTE